MIRAAINFHPHIHAIVSRGGWAKGGDWFPVPLVDARAAELLFRHKVLSLLRKAGLLDEQRIALLVSWKHTGLSVHNSVSVQPEDAEASERLVRYVMRAPVSQERLELDPDFGQVRLRAKAGADDEWAEDQGRTARSGRGGGAHPCADSRHNYGRYAKAARAKRTRDAAAEDQSLTATAAGTTPAASDEPDSAERKAARKR